MKLSSELPLYEAIRRDIRARIECGELAVGMRILPEIELAKQIGVSRSTARKALQALEDEGLISRTAGRGSFVTSPVTTINAASFKGTVAVCASPAVQPRLRNSFTCGVLATALTEGYRALAHPPHPEGVDVVDCLRELLRHAQGAIIWNEAIPPEATGELAVFVESGGALVLVGNPDPSFPCSTIVTEDRAMAEKLTAALIKRKHQRIALITEERDGRTPTERREGYFAALRQAGIEPSEDLLVTDKGEDDGALRLQLLALLGRKQRPTALVCATERYAAQVVVELESLGYQVPGDIELAVVHDGALRDSTVPLIAATVPAEELGEQAAQMLVTSLTQPEAQPQSRSLGFEFNF